MPDLRRWYTAAELAGMPGLPTTPRGVELLAEREGWDRRSVAEPQEHWVYAITSHSFPEGTHQWLLDCSRAEELLGPELEREPQPEATLPRYERDRALARRKILRALDAYEQARGGSDAREAFAADYRARKLQLPAYLYQRVKTLDARALTAWRVAEKNGGLDELAAGRRNTRETRGKVERQQELQQVVLGVMFKHPSAQASFIHEYLRAQHGELAEMVSPRTIHRFMERWKAAHVEWWTEICSPDRWKSKFQAAFGSASEGIVRLNQLWELDDTPADLLLVDGRHVLSGVIDVYSRRARLVVAKTSKAETVAAVFRRGLLEWGVCEKSRMDNGQNFRSKHVEALLSKLEIEVEHCVPFASEQKPFIERFFRSFSHDLLEMLPGFIGHNVAERRDIESRKAFATRIMTPGEVIDVKMTGAELQAFADKWCDSVYARNPHQGLGGRTPFAVAAAWSEPVRRIPDERALDVLLAPAAGDGRTVRKKGIEVDGAWYVDAALEAWIGRRVEVRLDPTDLGRVYVFGPEHEFVCIAQDPARVGLDRAEVAMMAKKKQKERRADLRRVARDTREELRADVATAILELREREAAVLVQGPRPREEVETPALAGAAEAVAARAELAAPRPIVRDPETLRRGAESIARAESEREKLRRVELEDAALDEADWQRAVRLESSPVMSTDERDWLERFRRTPLYRGRKHRQRVAGVG